MRTPCRRGVANVLLPGKRVGPLHEMRQQRAPARHIAVSPRLALGPESVPAAVLDLHARATLRTSDEPDLDLGRVRGVRPQVPAVDDARRWFPGQHAAPFVLDTLRRPLVDAAAGALLERHGQA